MESSEVRQTDEIDLLIDAWNGDIKALVSQLLEERSMLVKQIETAANAMSIGYARGWKPNIPE